MRGVTEAQPLCGRIRRGGGAGGRADRTAASGVIRRSAKDKGSGKRQSERSQCKSRVREATGKRDHGTPQSRERSRIASSGGHAPRTCQVETRHIVGVKDVHRQRCASQIVDGRDTGDGDGDAVDVGGSERGGFPRVSGCSSGVLVVVPAPHTSVLVILSWRGWCDARRAVGMSEYGCVWWVLCR